MAKNLFLKITNRLYLCPHEKEMCGENYIAIDYGYD
jgi:hypothetical protein